MLLGEKQTKRIEIESFYNAEFLAKVSKLAKKARKLGLSEPVATLISERTKKIEVDTDRGRVDRFLPMSLFEVTTPIVKVSGWQLVGTIDADPVVVNNAPHFTGSLEQFRANPTQCDHCNTNRDRNMTYVLKNDQGVLKQVGRSCLKDFTGHEVNGVYAFEMDLKDLEDTMPRGPNYMSTLSLLAYTLGLIKAWGWTSKGKAYDQGTTSTADHLFSVLNAKDKVEREICQDLNIERIQDLEINNRDQAKLVRAWVLDSDQASDYFQNLKSVLDCEYVKDKHVGVACSAAAVYLRDLEKKQEQKKAQLESNHVGNPGDKFGRKLSKKDKANGVESHPAIVATVAGVTYRQGDYGITSIIRFIDDVGNRYTWFASGEYSVESGDRFKIVATLKKHDSWNDIKSNILSRCKLTEIAA